MESLLIAVFRYFQTNRAIFWTSLVAILALMIWRATKLDLEEDITKIFPNDDRVKKVSEVFTNTRFADRLVLMISMRDSSLAAAPDSLTQCAGTLISEIESRLKPHIQELKSGADDDKIISTFQAVHDYLPVFLSDADYAALDTMIRADVAEERMLQNYKQLISPSGIMVKNTILHDPLGISFLVLAKLRGLQFDENFELYDNYIMTRDRRHLIFFIQPRYSANDVKNNTIFLDALDSITVSVGNNYPSLSIASFGSSRVALGNARQLQSDTILTVGLMLVILLVVLLGFFRKKRIPLFILIPVGFGALFALFLISFLQPGLSILALAVGAVILGVAVDYALHYLVLLKDLRSHEHVLRDVARPLVIGSATTVLAFLSLQFTNAAVLRDVGLFAALSLVGAALCALIILPQLVSPDVMPMKHSRWSTAIGNLQLDASKPVVLAILILTPILFYFAREVRFNQNMSSLNYMTTETREAEKRLESINKSSLSSVYVTSTGRNLEEALRQNEKTIVLVDRMSGDGTIKKVSTVSSFVISDSLQAVRLDRWRRFWTKEKKESLMSVIRAEAAELRYSPIVVSNFDSLISRQYAHIPDSTKSNLINSFFADHVLNSDSAVTIVNLLNPAPGKKEIVYEKLTSSASASFDRQMITNLFVSYVNADFNFIVTVTSVIVFFALLLVYGRIELTLITFVPMLFTWIWILGIMALLDIEFNIVNVMVSTFIFGLGDDYSIFVMDGLQQEYRTGKKTLASVKLSIFLSAFTTIIGLGVLIFAKHPALKSIAAISIIGIICVFLMSQTIEPYLFRWMITNRTKKGLSPMTFRGMMMTLYTYGFFVLGSFFLTIVGLLLKLIPIARKQIRFIFHWLISHFTRALLYGSFNLKKQIIGKNARTFSRSSVVICNHSSFLDIIATTMLHPKLLLLTNKWVWNSPVFGGVVRLADYYPVMEGAEDSVSRLRSRVEEGYSVVVFPEGTRSVDGRIQRFHKGAFYLAQELTVPIQPLLIHGVDMGIRKNDIYVNDAKITLKFLPPIEADDPSYGATYSERTKSISRYFRKEHDKLRREQETPDYFRHRLYTNYLYKGPVLEWYMRIKVRLEDYYKIFHELVPEKAHVIDLGCGYGFLCYMLQFLSQDRVITGVDYDLDKIETAQHGYLRSDRLNFIHADVTTYSLTPHDVIIISDVLHYLSASEQEELINRCFDALNPGGKVIIRDGNKDLADRHKGTKLTEFFSVKVLKFNKSRNDLTFVSGNALTELAKKRGLYVNIHDETRFTSNVIFVISKPMEVHAAI